MNNVNWAKVIKKNLIYSVKVKIPLYFINRETQLLIKSNLDFMLPTYINPERKIYEIWHLNNTIIKQPSYYVCYVDKICMCNMFKILSTFGGDK